MSNLTTIKRLEIFRVGTHGGSEFTPEDLAGIAENFHRLSGEVRPKLKITHRGGESLTGLASYGDVVRVWAEDGKLYADIDRVPKEIIPWIEEGRFPERSIEIYPEFRLGTDKGHPVYKNVLKAVALLGHEMPAVPGMAPVRMAEKFEAQPTRVICNSGICAAQFSGGDIAKLINDFESKLRAEGF